LALFSDPEEGEEVTYRDDDFLWVVFYVAWNLEEISYLNCGPTMLLGPASVFSHLAFFSGPQEVEVVTYRDDDFLLVFSVPRDLEEITYPNCGRTMPLGPD
jgi:hypothetical protein